MGRGEWHRVRYCSVGSIQNYQTVSQPYLLIFKTKILVHKIFMYQNLVLERTPANALKMLHKVRTYVVSPKPVCLSSPMGDTVWRASSVHVHRTVSPTLMRVSVPDGNPTRHSRVASEDKRRKATNAMRTCTHDRVWSIRRGESKRKYNQTNYVFLTNAHMHVHVHTIVFEVSEGAKVQSIMHFATRSCLIYWKTSKCAHLISVHRVSCLG